MSTTWQTCVINDNIDKKVKILKFFNTDGNHKVSEIQDVHKKSPNSVMMDGN